MRPVELTVSAPRCQDVHLPVVGKIMDHRRFFMIGTTLLRSILGIPLNNRTAIWLRGDPIFRTRDNVAPSRVRGSGDECPPVSLYQKCGVRRCRESLCNSRGEGHREQNGDATVWLRYR